MTGTMIRSLTAAAVAVAMPATQSGAVTAAVGKGRV